MNTVSKNIKRLRMRDSISQETLAEKLNVTRQAISNWETGKTQPDIDTLVAISAALHVDINELIYGTAPREDPNPDNKKKRKIVAVIFGSITVLFIFLEIFLVPYLSNLANLYYNVYPITLFMYFLRPLFYISTVLFFFTMLSLFYDIRLKKAGLRKFMTALSLLLVIFYYLVAANSFLGILPLNSPLLAYYYIVPLVKNPTLFLILGTVLFFGLNK